MTLDLDKPAISYLYMNHACTGFLNRLGGYHSIIRETISPVEDTLGFDISWWVIQPSETYFPSDFKDEGEDDVPR